MYMYGGVTTLEARARALVRKASSKQICRAPITIGVNEPPLSTCIIWTPSYSVRSLPLIFKYHFNSNKQMITFIVINK